MALALVAQLDRLGETFLVFALAVLPALLVLGMTSYARLADLAVHDAYYARAIGRIRSFYFTIEPGARHYWLLSAGDDPHALLRHTGQRHSRWHHLSHAATAVGAVTAIVAGVLVGVAAARTTSLPLQTVAAASSVLSLGVIGGLLVDQERRWRRSEMAEPTLFEPDGSPVAPRNSVRGATPAPSPIRGIA